MNRDRLRLDCGDYLLLSRQPMEMPQLLERSALIQAFLMQQGIPVVDPELDILSDKTGGGSNASPPRSSKRRLRRPPKTRNGALRRRGAAGPCRLARFRGGR